MSNCCANGTIHSQVCPGCTAVCKSVGMSTLYHQLKAPANLMIAEDNYYFCATKLCSIAYFSHSGHIIPKQQLLSYQAILEDTLCYCFGITSEFYRSALQENQADSIKNFIVQRTKSGECACESKNPSGGCCLSKFKGSS